MQSMIDKEDKNREKRDSRNLKKKESSIYKDKIKDGKLFRRSSN